MRRLHHYGVACNQGGCSATDGIETWVIEWGDYTNHTERFSQGEM